MPPDLRRSLDVIRRLMPLEQPWWLIGSAALLRLFGRPKDVARLALMPGL